MGNLPQRVVLDGLHELVEQVAAFAGGGLEGGQGAGGVVETGVRVPFLTRDILLRRFCSVVQLATRLEVAVQRA